MIPLSEVAEQQLTALVDHYQALGRTEASFALLDAIQRASETIARLPAAGLPAPRPYPGLARYGLLWTKSGRYWVAYIASPLLIRAIFYDAANIPARLPELQG